jgi:hypothetical protein
MKGQGLTRGNLTLRYNTLVFIRVWNLASHPKEEHILSLFEKKVQRRVLDRKLEDGENYIKRS